MTHEADNPMTACDFDWMVSNHAVWGWKAPVKASVSGVSLLQLSPFFASIFPLFPQKRLILRLVCLTKHKLYVVTILKRRVFILVFIFLKVWHVHDRILAEMVSISLNIYTAIAHHVASVDRKTVN